MTFKQRLAEAGATDQQIQSKTANLCEAVVAEMSMEDKMDVSLVKVQTLLEEMKEVGEKLMIENDKSVANAHKLRDLNIEASDLSYDILTATVNLAVKPTEETKQALLIYKSVLEVTRQIFGDALSDEVMKQAIETGGYGMWRSIMGEAQPPRKRL